MGLKNETPIMQTDGEVKFGGIGLKPSLIPDRQIKWIRIAGEE
jgi:hypothetical protein